MFKAARACCYTPTLARLLPVFTEEAFTFWNTPELSWWGTFRPVPRAGVWPVRGVCILNYGLYVARVGTMLIASSTVDRVESSFAHTPSHACNMPSLDVHAHACVDQVALAAPAAGNNNNNDDDDDDAAGARILTGGTSAFGAGLLHLSALSLSRSLSLSLCLSLPTP